VQIALAILAALEKLWKTKAISLQTKLSASKTDIFISLGINK